MSWQIQQHVPTQAPDDTWEARDLQNKEEFRKRIEAKEAKRLQQEAEERLTMSPEEIGMQSWPCWSLSLCYITAMQTKPCLDMRDMVTSHL